MTKFGFSINPTPRLVTDEQITQFSTLAVANISDAMSRTNGTSHLRPFHRSGRVVGRALTVKTAPGDNLMVHKAINMAAAGDVIVVDAGGSTLNAIIGEIMSAEAARRGVVGFVIDGAIRDSDVLGKDDFAVFARGVSHRGPYKEGPGEINVPISIDGMVVMPGDLIVGDSDGVLAIRPDIASELAQQVILIEKKEQLILAEIANGESDRSWVDETLRKKGVDV
jgi:RraA family protein